MNNTDYKTTRSKSARNGLLRNAIAVGVGVAVFFWSWLHDGGMLNAIVVVVFSLMLLVIVLTFFRIKTPLQIVGDKVIVSSLSKVSIPLSKIHKIGEHPTRKTPSLSYSDPDKGHAGEFVLPWKFIAEPENEVLAKLQSAIDESNKSQ